MKVAYPLWTSNGGSWLKNGSMFNVAIQNLANLERAAIFSNKEEL